ncbi:aminoglycoside phosphotransferase family protein [Streptomyces sp. NPDC052077]|uniref:phosphotransferase family protein n=1 Tax=Streptomyces sp. NPDC052077 TaxID=3154757 RepID=UPI003423BDBD
MTPAPLLAALADRVRAFAHTPAGQDPPPAVPHCDCPSATLVQHPDTTVVRHAAAVAKAHAPDSDPDGLAHRVAVATGLPGVLLPPLAPAPATLHGRLVTYWPHGRPVDPGDPDAAPWEAAATLLARLHRSPLLPGPPPMRGPAKTARAVAALRALPRPVAGTAAVLRAWDTLPAWARGEAPMPREGAALCHGDFHLGQLVRHPVPRGPWLLIDVDDLGAGVPAWDLARPAAWYACGLLPSGEWDRFLAAYRAARGPAVPPDGDPWPVLEVPARALTVQTAARALTKAAEAERRPDEGERRVIDACARMAAVPLASSRG